MICAVPPEADPLHVVGIRSGRAVVHQRAERDLSFGLHDNVDRGIALQRGRGQRSDLGAAQDDRQRRTTLLELLRGSHQPPDVPDVAGETQDIGICREHPFRDFRRSGVGSEFEDGRVAWRKALVLDKGRLQIEQCQRDEGRVAVGRGQADFHS